MPYLVYMPEKDRLLLLVSCDYPHHAEISSSDDRGASWSPPKPALVRSDGKPLAGLGTPLFYLAGGSKPSLSTLTAPVQKLGKFKHQRTPRLPGLRSIVNVCLRECGEGLTW